MRTLKQIKREENVNSLRAIQIQFEEAEGPLDASPCSPERGYETFIKETQLTMNFRTRADAVAFFDWIMENTNHKKQNAPVDSTRTAPEASDT